MSDHLRPHDAALARLHALHPKLIDLSLGRIERLMAKLGHPERRLPPVVHVAGTNGKGSTIAFLRAMAEAAGMRVHVFTSPHLVRFVERVRLAGTLITEAQLAEVLERIEQVNAGEPITFFEVTTAAALQAFAEASADLCLIEVGLGGRFDATNVVTPTVSVITPVAIDHREFLGDRVDQIAGEKAGILKAGALGVVAHQIPAALAVIEAQAERVGAPLRLAGRDFDAWAERGGMAFQDEAGLLDLPAPVLPGAHQIGNAGVAIAAARALGFEPQAISAGLASVRWPARMQRLTAGPLAQAAQARGSDLWLDGAHNPHGAAALARAAVELRARDGRSLAVILGLLATKDADGVLNALAALAPFQLVLTGFEGASADPNALAERARALGLPATAAARVSEALAQVLAGEGPAPHVLICGSLHLAGEVLSLSPETWPT